MPQYVNARFVRLLGRIPIEKGWQDKELSWDDVAGDESYGINCGASGLVVIDTDVTQVSDDDGEPLCLFGEQALDEFLWWTKRELPETFTVRTPRGGLHRYYLLPPGEPLGNQTGWLPAVDYKSTGGYVIAAGSCVPADPARGKPAGRYAPVDSSAPVAEAPPWLLDALRTRQHGDRRGSAVGGSDGATGGERDDLWDFGSPVPLGQRDDVAFKFASSLRNSGLGKTHAKQLMELRHHDFAQPPDDPYPLSEALAKIDRAWANYPAPTADPEQVKVAAQLAASMTGPVSQQLGTRADHIRARLLAEDELDSLPEPEYLIGGELVPLDAVGMLVGSPGTGKTLLELGWALSIASGTPWAGRPVRQGAVLYVYAEGARGLRMRRDAWRASNGGVIVGGAAKFYPSTVPLMDAAWVAGLVEVVAELRPVLVVIDTLARATAGADENSVKDMGRALEAAHAVREAATCAVQLVHHTNRSGEYRGSSAIEAAVTDMVALTRLADSNLLMRSTKRNDGEPFEDVFLRFQPVEQSGVLVPNDGITALLGAGNDGAVLTALTVHGPGTAREVADRTGLHSKAVQRALRSLMDKAEVVRDGPDSRPVYRRAAVI